MGADDLERRFAGIARLYGTEGAQKLWNSHGCVVGIGGVGSWCVEALARMGIRNITLIDLDVIAESNVNRQIHAIESNFGKAKVEAMRERIAEINPICQVTCIDDFLTPQNVGDVIKKDCSFVIDAIDQVRAKVALIAHCVKERMPVISCGAAGGKIDPFRLQSKDLAFTTQDPLLAKVRASLRREHGFPRGSRKFGVNCIFSTEPVRSPQAESTCTANRGPQGLNCAGYGSSICVTAPMGLMAAGEAINTLLTKPPPKATTQ